MGDASAVRRLLRRGGEGLLQEGRARREDPRRRPGHLARAGCRRRAGPDGPRLAAEPDVGARSGPEAHQHRTGLHSERYDGDQLEGQRNQHDRENARQEGRQLAARERIRALRGARAGRHGSRAQQGRDDRQAAVRHEPIPQSPDRRRLRDDLQRAGPGAGDEEPEDRKPVQAQPAQRDQDVEDRDRNARGWRLHNRVVDQGQEEPGNREEVPRGVLQRVDLLPYAPEGLREDRPVTWADAAQGTPDVADERDQRVDLAFAEGHRPDERKGLRLHGEDHREVQQAEEGAGPRGLPNRYREGRPGAYEEAASGYLRKDVEEGKRQGDARRQVTIGSGGGARRPLRS